MQPSERFREAIGRPDDEVPLDEVALCIAAHARPGLDIDAQLLRLDDLAAGCPQATVEGLMQHLFADGRFTGDTVTYDDPANSMLDQVLDRHLGLPITLSVLAIEVGRRIGVGLVPVGMPGHVLVRNDLDRTLFADPFHGGRLLDPAACRRLFHRIAGGDAVWQPSYLDPTPRSAIVARMLNNLRGAYLRRDDERASRWVARLRCMLPSATPADHDELARLMAPFN